MKSIRILFFISSLNCGGAENHLLNICRFLSGQGHYAAVCSLSGGGDDLEEKFRELGTGLSYLNLPSLASFCNPARVGRLRRIVKTAAPDIIHAHLYHAEATAALGSLFCDAPLIVTRHSSGLEFNGFRRLVTGAASSRIDRLIAVSSQAADEASKTGTDRERISVIESGIDTDLFRPLSGDQREKERRNYLNRLFGSDGEKPLILIGSVGGLRPVKNFELFLRMAGRLTNSGSGLSQRLRFVITGEGGQRERLRKLIDELDIGDVTAMPGRTESPEKVIPLFDIFVLTSDSEGVPVAFLEAMSCGVPCVASRVGGIPDAAAGNSLLPEAGDLDGFVRSVSSLAEDGRQRDRIGARNREIAVERYGLEGWGSRILSVYSSALKTSQAE
ncbi:MAG: glycosyltransferase [Candidatus Krumholzibacteriales bacterium]